MRGTTKEKVRTRLSFVIHHRVSLSAVQQWLICINIFMRDIARIHALWTHLSVRQFLTCTLLFSVTCFLNGNRYTGTKSRTNRQWLFQFTSVTMKSFCKCEKIMHAIMFPIKDITLLPLPLSFHKLAIFDKNASSIYCKHPVQFKLFL